MNVGVRDLKSRLSHYLDRVRHGERLVVTDRGRPVARIEPMASEEMPESIRRLIESGRLVYRGRPDQFFDEPTVSLLPGDKTSTDFVREQRR